MVFSRRMVALVFSRRGLASGLDRSRFGGEISGAQALRGPTTRASTSAEHAVHSWTTVPPAKSLAPISSIQPSGPQTQWHTGAYTSTDHTRMNAAYALNRIRSTTDPDMMAAPITAKVIWKTQNNNIGNLVFGHTLCSMSGRPTYSKPPMKPPPTPCPKANEKPRTIQEKDTMPMAMMLIIIVL